MGTVGKAVRRRVRRPAWDISRHPWTVRKGGTMLAPKDTQHTQRVREATLDALVGEPRAEAGIALMDGRNQRSIASGHVA